MPKSGWFPFRRKLPIRAFPLNGDLLVNHRFLPSLSSSLLLFPRSSHRTIFVYSVVCPLGCAPCFPFECFSSLFCLSAASEGRFVSSGRTSFLLSQAPSFMWALTPFIFFLFIPGAGFLVCEHCLPSPHPPVLLPKDMSTLCSHGIPFFLPFPKTFEYSWFFFVLFSGSPFFRFPERIPVLSD